jgi:hypothetical protein
VTAVGWDRDDDGCNGVCCHNAHRVRLLTPLPARIRLRLAVHGRIDRAGAWLCGNRCARAAVWLWRASGMA